MPEDFPNGDGNNLIHPVGQGVVTLRDVLRKIEAFVNKCPGLEFVLVVARKGDYGRVAATRNVPRPVARQMLQVAVDGINTGRIMVDDGPKPD